LLNINIIKKTAVIPVPFERHIWCCFTYKLCLLRWRFENVWKCGLTCIFKKIEFFLLKFNMICMFWIVLMC